MLKEISDNVAIIDSIICQNKWFDFHVLNYDGFKLTVAGGVDLHYYHSLEIIFTDVHFVSGFFNSWRSDTKFPVLILPENIKALNQKYEIEEGYQLYVFKIEDYKNDFIIAAKMISYDTNTVYYYERENLKENERIADFVKRKII